MSGELTLSKRVISVFDTAQDGLRNQAKLAKSLKKIEDEVGVQDFYPVFLQTLKCALVISKKEPAVERSIRFAAHYAAKSLASAADDDEVGNKALHMLLLKDLLSYHEAADKAVRFRSCQLVALMIEEALKMVDETLNLSQELTNAIETTLIERLYDKAPVVRAQAVHTLHKLQDIEDLGCPIVSEFVNLLEHDTAVEVRKSVLSVIVLNKKTLPVIIGRTRDTSAKIRQQAYAKLAECCTIRHLTIAQRVSLLRYGLQDPDKEVEETCIHSLLRSWCQLLDDDFLQLLHCLDVETASDVAELALLKLFAHIDRDPLVDNLLGFINWRPPQEDKENVGDEVVDQAETDSLKKKLVPLELLSCEIAFYWRCLCKYFKEAEDEVHLERIMPSLTDYCEYLKKFHKEAFAPNCNSSSSLEYTFIYTQLMYIQEFMDFSDEVGRRNLGSTAVNLLVSSKFPAGMVAPLMARQLDIWPQQSYRVEKVLEVIAEIGLPLDGATLASITTSAPPLGNSSEVEGELNQTQELDSDVMLKCLALASELLVKIRLPKLTPNLQMLVETLLLPAVPNEDPYVRDMALHALALACLLDKKQAEMYFYVFVKAIQIDLEQIQATAMKAAFDLIIMYGFECFHLQETQNEEEGVKEVGEVVEPSAPEGTTTEKILKFLTDFLDTEGGLLKEVACEGFAKLFVSGRLASQQLLARLIVIWYNPLTQEEERLASLLGLFLEVFASLNLKNRELLSAVFVPVLKAVLSAPSTSPLSKVNVNNVVEHLLFLMTEVKTVNAKNPSDYVLMGPLAEEVANEALNHPTDPSVRTYCKALSMMKISEEEQDAITVLDVLTDTLLENVCDRLSIGYLNKLKTKLTSIKRSEKPVGSQEGSGAEERTEEGSEGNEEGSSPPSDGQDPVAGEELGTAGTGFAAAEEL